jgi:hypothetical protein
MSYNIFTAPFKLRGARRGDRVTLTVKLGVNPVGDGQSVEGYCAVK